MGKMIRHDYYEILNAMNRVIVAEVKAALELLPEKKIERMDNVPLCRILVSRSDDYKPQDLSVNIVWLDEENTLCFSEYLTDVDKDGIYTFTEYDDMLDITDFSYLIEQIGDKLEDNKTYNLITLSEGTSETAPELDLKAAISKTVDYR